MRYVRDHRSALRVDALLWSVLMSLQGHDYPKARMDLLLVLNPPYYGG